MPEVNWKNEAKKAVDKISTALSEVHRGAVSWHGPTNTLAAFDNRAVPREQIKFLTARFEKLNIPVRAIAIDNEEPSFVMLVESTNADQLTDILWESFWSLKCFSDVDQESKDFMRSYQGDIASKRLKRYELGLESWWDHQVSGTEGDPALYLHEFVELYDENRRTIKPTRDGLKFIKQAKDRVGKFAKEFGLTADQAIRVYEAFPDAQDWIRRNVKEMHDGLPPASTPVSKPRKKKPSSPKAVKKKTKKKPVSKKTAKTPPAKKKTDQKKKVAKKTKTAKKKAKKKKR